MNIFEPWKSVLSAPLFYNLHIFSAPFNPSFLVSFELKFFVLGFWEINYLYIFEMKILKCGVSLERLFKSGVSLEDCKGCLEPKVQVGGLEP